SHVLRYIQTNTLDDSARLAAIWETTDKRMMDDPRRRGLLVFYIPAVLASLFCDIASCR
ncbi:hypothetical protein BDR05DRAFT_955929, partial [Suillus weaverae]